MFSLKFNQVVACALAAAATLASGCTPREKTAEETAHQAAGVNVYKNTCTVIDNNPQKAGFEGYMNNYDFRNGVLTFHSDHYRAHSIPMKDLAEDGQARAIEMFRFLDGTNCKPPKFGN